MSSMPALARSFDAGQGPGTITPPTQSADSLNGVSVAYASPRNTPPNGVEVVLARPLSPSDVALYRRALHLQQEGAYAEANAMLARVSDKSLVGIVLAQRYLSSHYITRPAELTAWWARYAQTPMAPQIYALMQHKIARARLPAPPVQALIPEQSLAFSGAATTAYAPNEDEWRHVFLRGLDAWKTQNYQRASEFFCRSAKMSGISNGDRATADFWAARAALRLRQPQHYLDWLHQASWQAGTFYGMLAKRLLGQQALPSFGTSTTLTEADITAVDSLPDGHLAFALLQVGLHDEAKTALRALWPQIQKTPGLGHAVMAVAARAGLLSVTAALAQTLPSANEYAGIQLPVPPLNPQGGFSVNPALIYALARTESGFNPDARSAVGARGLMQLMPRTANSMRRQNDINGAITNPAANLAMGQAYLKYLANQPGINGNLLAILASYNAGPNAAAAWYGKLSGTSDPLLFIESIPDDQTRHFVHQVLADSWIYDAEIGIPSYSLNELAEGSFPQLDGVTPANAAIETADTQ